MAILTLEADRTPCAWPAIEPLLTGLFIDLKMISQTTDRRTYQFNLPTHRQPIPLFMELQVRLGHEDVHFFSDLNP